MSLSASKETFMGIVSVKDTVSPTNDSLRKDSWRVSIRLDRHQDCLAVSSICVERNVAFHNAPAPK